MSEPAARRRYDSPVRKAQAAQTRERIIAAGAELVHGFAVWNWQALTVRAVADLAEVSERTVYRHFTNERELRDAVLERLEAEAGVDLDGLRLEELQKFATQVLEYVSSFPLEDRAPQDPSLVAMSERLRAALVSVVTPWTETWSEQERTVAAGMLDVLWSLQAYERLVVGWGAEPAEAIAGVTWVIGLVEDAIRDGRRPPT